MVKEEVGTWKLFGSQEDTQAFKKILGLLVKFDEMTGRHLRYKDCETHFFRKSLVECSVESSIFFVRKEAANVYTVIGEVKSLNGYVCTTWTHEDGIGSERETAEKDHPVHSIVSLGDLYSRCYELGAPFGIAPDSLSATVQEFMTRKD